MSIEKQNFEQAREFLREELLRDDLDKIHFLMEAIEVFVQAKIELYEAEK